MYSIIIKLYYTVSSFLHHFITWKIFFLSSSVHCLLKNFNWILHIGHNVIWQLKWYHSRKITQVQHKFCGKLAIVENWMTKIFFWFFLYIWITYGSHKTNKTEVWLPWWWAGFLSAGWAMMWLAGWLCEPVKWQESESRWILGSHRCVCGETHK